MSIALTCACGQTVAADGEPGAAVRCPKCGSEVSGGASRPARYQVFVSHAVEDVEVATAVVRTLESQGIRCWIAPRDILPGRDWADVIAEATDACRGMVLVYSRHSNASAHVRREVERAVGAGGFLIPFRIEDVPMSRALAYFLHSCQWLDAQQPPLAPHLKVLATTVRTLLQKEAPAATFARLALERRRYPPQPPAAKRAAIIGGALAGGLLLCGLLALGLWLTGRRGEPEQPPTARAPVSAWPIAPNVVPAIAPSVMPIMATTKDAGKMPTPAEVVLRGGNFFVRSEGLTVRGGTAPPAGKPIVLVSNRQGAKDDDPTGQQATLTLQLNNQSHEEVTISQVELVLLGIVRTFEDAIPEPAGISVPQPPPDLVVEASDRKVRLGALNLAEVFRDENDPPSPLRFTAEAYPTGIIATRVDASGKFDLAFLVKHGGAATVRLSATNAFDRTATAQFGVKLKGPLLPLVQEQLPSIFVERAAPRTRSGVANLAQVFRDVNEPPSPLRFTATADPPGLVVPRVETGGTLTLVAAPDRGGTATVTLTATNAFELSVTTQFIVTVEAPPDPTAIAIAERLAPLNQPAYQPVRPGYEVAVLPHSVGSQAVPGLIEKFAVDTKILDAGQVVLRYTLGASDAAANGSSGNLLSAEESTHLRANLARSVSVRVRCLTDFQLAEGKDLLVGEQGRRLTSYPPRPTAIAHLVGIRVRVNSEDGTRADLYGDNLYLLHSYPGSLAGLSYGAEVTPDKLLAALVEPYLRTTSQTLVYQRALACGLTAPAADEIAEFCYFSQPQHVFRQPVASPASGGPWARSNLATTLAAIAADHPPLGKLLEESLTKLAESGDPAATAKVQHLQQALQKPRGSSAPQPAYVQVLSP